MEYYTYVLNELEFQSVLLHYNNKVKANEPYVLYYVNNKDYKIKIYQSYKLLFIGKNFYNEILVLDKLLNRVQVSSIGSDEVGLGDLFGPIVIASCFLAEKDVLKVMKLGVKDSKNISDEKIIELAEALLNDFKLPNSVLILDNEKFNEINKKYNMNEIKARMHNQAILKTIKKCDSSLDKIIIDQFCSPDLYYYYLNDVKDVIRNITFKTKAESRYLSVACASIIARYTFLKKFDELANKVSYKLLKGCSNEVKKQFKEIKEKSPEILNKIAKLNFNVEE